MAEHKDRPAALPRLLPDGAIEVHTVAQWAYFVEHASLEQLLQARAALLPLLEEKARQGYSEAIELLRQMRIDG